MASTTPPPMSTINIPQTPRYGTYEDNYEPYALRKSTRIQQRSQRALQTPSSHRRTRLSSPTSGSSSMGGSPKSPALNKRVTKTSPPMSNRRFSNNLNDSNSTSTTDAPDLSKSESLVARTLRHNGMLPTPAKSPIKRPSKIASAISSIARNLFPVRPDSTVEEIMPMPKKKSATKYSLSNFGEVEEAGPIQIYTDSHDRIPEIDKSEDNPFYGQKVAVAEPTKRTSKRRKVSGPGEVEQTLDEAQKREDGMVYVFRGKKIFRKFADRADDGSMNGDGYEADLGADLDATVPARLRGPMTRSSIKPRLLFPTTEQLAAKAKKSAISVDDEEADTDIEGGSTDSSTPAKQIRNLSVTPQAPDFALASPPTTARATRSKMLDDMSSSKPTTPIKSVDVTFSSDGHGRAERTSPYNSWKRTKSTARKRAGDSLTRSGGDITKRHRGEVV